MAWFLDTNVCIQHWRGQHPPAKEVFVPLTVYAELLVGAEKSSQPNRVLQQIETLLEAHEIIEITDDLAEHYARTRAILERRGVIIGGNDLWIAATALAHGATLVSANTGEFTRIPGLAIEDWSHL